MKEIRIQWSDMADDEKKEVIEGHLIMLKCPREKHERLVRIFNLANPVIVLGKDDLGGYCRVDAESIAVVNLLIQSYW